MGRAVSVNFASFLASGLKQVNAGALETAAKRLLAISLQLPGIPFDEHLWGRARMLRDFGGGATAKSMATHNENNIADPTKDRRVNIQ